MIDVGQYVIFIREDGIIPQTSIGRVTNNEEYDTRGKVIVKILISPKHNILDAELYSEGACFVELSNSSVEAYFSKPTLKIVNNRLLHDSRLSYIPNCYGRDTKVTFNVDILSNYPQETLDGRMVGSILRCGTSNFQPHHYITVPELTPTREIAEPMQEPPREEESFATLRSFRELYNASNYIIEKSKKPERPREKLSIDEPFTTKQLLEIFKFVPIKLNNRYGFYDHKNSKIVTFGKDIYGKPDVLIQSNCKADVQFDLCHKFNIHGLFEYCKFKVKSCDKSSTLFRFGALKRSLIGKQLPATQLAINVRVNNSEELQNTIFIVTEGRNTRFALEDIEITYPNINGYYPKADRTIRAGNKVKVINDKHMIHFKKGDTTKVQGLKKIGYKIYAEIKVNDKIIYERLNKFKKIC